MESIPDVSIESLTSFRDSNGFFRDFCKSLKTPVSKKFIDYYNDVRMERYGIGGILPAEYSNEYNKISEDWQRKVVTVGIDDDLVIIILKKVQMFKYVYLRMEGLPISISKNKKNEVLVLNTLFNNDIVHKIGCLENESEILDDKFTFSEKIDSYNFYSYIPDNYKKISVNKWKTKKGIKRMLNMSNLNWKVLTEYNPSIPIINNGFDRWKKEVEGTHKGWHKLSKGINNYKFWEDKNVLYYLFSYKDIPIALCVYIVIDNKCHQIVNKSFGHCIFEDDIFSSLNEDELNEIEELKKRTNALIHYITIEDLNNRNIEHGYFGGAFSMKSLRKYKQIMNDEEIEHHIFKLKEE